MFALAQSFAAGRSCAPAEVLESGVFKQEPDREAGDIAPEWGPWVRYDDPEAKTFKLNVERQNGRAAMLGRAGACAKSGSGDQRYRVYVFERYFHVFPLIGAVEL